MTDYLFIGAVIFITGGFAGVLVAALCVAASGDRRRDE